ncbi:MAG: RNA polymerase sporulation sigma factor SigG [Clostridia bacterium]|nr:RNA polymerase sporulation sigma factor SigG [Clostridia bacterium]
MAYLCKVEICGVDTSKLKVLKADEMRELFLKLDAGETWARQELINGNLRLVLSIIQRFSNRGENPDDLFQVGCVGLMKSIDNFDTSLNVRFSTYAVPMIIGEIRRYLRDNNAIRVSRSLRDLAYKALGVREQLAKETGQEPHIEQIAKRMEVTVQEVACALDAIAEPVSLYEPVYRDSGDAIYIVDQIHDEKQGEDAWVQDLSIRQAMQKLAPREQHIVKMRFFLGRTQMEVAKEVGISQAQVSRLEKSALKKMRKQM